jgi:phage I-like protein
MTAVETQETLPQMVALPFPEGDAPEWVMLARVGVWHGHPTVGTQRIAPEHLRGALDYFNRHYAAHGKDLVVDYDHASVAAPAVNAPAAGWIRGLELREGDTELWGRVQWTTEAANAIAGRRYRYVSPVFRFNQPDRVTGEPVPMTVHSLALTNTPFLTELEALNNVAAKDGGNTPHSDGGAQMSLLDQLAEALDRQPAEFATPLGLSAGARDRELAEAVLALADPEDETQTTVPNAVTAALGLPPEADETAVKAAIIRLKAPGDGLDAVRRALGLAESAPAEQVLNSIAELRQDRRRGDAEQMVAQAVEAGKIPPAHRDFYLREALDDPEAARQVINSLPVLTAPPPRPAEDARAALSEAERSVCAQLGITADAFAEAAE